MLRRLKALVSGGQRMDGKRQQRILETGAAPDRKALAEHPSARPEVLYYLAEDADASVRAAVAGHAGTPIQASLKLAGDDVDGVREELARKIGRILPDLGPDARDVLREAAIAVLERLAADQLPKVRAIMAEEIKASDTVPAELVQKLARDVEDLVAHPILQYSPLLADTDLREIIAAGATSGSLTAIAKRSGLVGDVAADISETLDVPAVSALLTNSSAQIREETLDQIIDQAREASDLHKSLALRPQLSIRAVKRVAGFVASSLIHQMLSNADIDQDQADDVLSAVHERLSGERLDDDEVARLAARAQEFLSGGMLDDSFFVEQVEAGNRELVIQCLAARADLPGQVVRTIIFSKSGRAVTALCWRAGLTMRTAYELQTKLALVPSAQLLSAKDGVDYPLPDAELDWHLSYFTDA